MSALAILIILLFCFLLLFAYDFEFFNKKTWNILLGLSGVGGVLSLQLMEKRGYLNALESRRDRVATFKEHYKKLLKANSINQAAYDQKVHDLEAIEKDAYISILKSSGLFKEYEGEEGTDIYEVDSNKLYDKIYSKIKGSRKLK